MFETLATLALTAPIVLGYGIAEILKIKSRIATVMMIIMTALLCYSIEYFMYAKTGFPPYMRWFASAVAQEHSQGSTKVTNETCFDDGWCFAENVWKFSDETPNFSMIFMQPPFATIIVCYPSSDRSFLIVLLELIQIGRRADSKSSTNAVLFTEGKQEIAFLEMVDMDQYRRAAILGNSFRNITSKVKPGDMIGFGNGDGEAVKFDAVAFMARSAEFGARCESFLDKPKP